MRVLTFSGFMQEKFEFIFNGRILSEKGAEIAAILDILPLRRFVPSAAYTGRPPESRLCILKSFLLKSALNIMENKKLREILLGNDELRKLCGWDEVHNVPSESTFSRVFRDFAQMNVAEHIHEYLVKTAFNDKIIMHISRDATAVPARERFRKKSKPHKVKGKSGRPKKGTPPKPKELTRLQKQLDQSFDEMVSELPLNCDSGSKINSQGNPEHWRGYKLHADFSDEGIPISFMVTAASVHDSQVAIPLTLRSSSRATYFYELMDAGYDMSEIKTISKNCNHASIIKPNNRRSKIKRELDPASARRYRIRTTAERGFSELKDNYGIEKSRFRGHAKIKTHIGFSIIILTMKKIFQFGYGLEAVKQENAA